MALAAPQMPDPFREVAALEPVDPAPFDDLGAYLNGVCGTENFLSAVEHFSDYPALSPLNPRARAYLYQLIRSRRPGNILEVGTGRAGTTEVLARAVAANRGGTLFTIEGDDAGAAETRLAEWPAALREKLNFLATMSMPFSLLATADGRALSIDLAVINTAEGAERTLSDLLMISRLMVPGAILILSHGESPTVKWAARQFLSINPAWHELSGKLAASAADHPLRPAAPSVPDTGLLILLAPQALTITEAPARFAYDNLAHTALAGFDLTLAKGCTGGTLYAMASSGDDGGDGGGDDTAIAQVFDALAIPAGWRHAFVRFDVPLEPRRRPGAETGCCQVTLSWRPAHGGQPLGLVSAPEPIPHHPFAAK